MDQYGLVRLYAEMERRKKLMEALRMREQGMQGNSQLLQGGMPRPAMPRRVPRQPINGMLPMGGMRQMPMGNQGQIQGMPGMQNPFKKPFTGGY